MILSVIIMSLMATTAEASKILFMLSTVSPSHFNVFSPILHALSSTNHDVTLLSIYVPKHPIPRLKILQLNSVGMDENDMKNFIDKTVNSGPIQKMMSAGPFSVGGCQAFLTDNATQKILSEGLKYDLAIVDEVCAECTAAVAHLLARNTMYVSTTFTLPWKWSNVPSPPSFVPLFFDHLPSKMDFWQRLQNTVNTVAVRFVNTYMFNREQQLILSQHAPEAPRIEESEKKIDFWLVNADPVMESPRPSLPNVVAVGGMHCVDPKRLPEDLEEFVASSGDDGFIVFSLGTNAKSSFQTTEFNKALLTVFSRLKQRIVWKYEGQIDNLPANMKLTTWLPQQDLLGHPKIRLFITHAGLLSLQEAIYHAVPVIAIPFFADQPANAVRIEELEIGKRIQVSDVTAERLYNLITEILNENRYKENVKKYSSIYRDQPQKPLDRAMFWIEYVLRHDGAPHLRTAGEDLNFIQYFLLDVTAFLVLAGIATLGIIVVLVKLGLRVLFTHKPSDKLFVKKTK